LPGLYNSYNTQAAVSVAKVLGIENAIIKKALDGFSPAFGRQEEFIVTDKKVKIFLSKNPAGYNASLRTILEFNPKVLLLVLNDRIPDGRDVSWIWDVDFEMMPKSINIFVSGDRVYDLGLRLKYANIPVSRIKVMSNLKKAVSEALTMTKPNKTLYILPTYSAMLEVRKILKGRSIL
jgi:UDP-N-acetylmuramyl tripeptide synthase